MPFCFGDVSRLQTASKSVPDKGVNTKKREAPFRATLPEVEAPRYAFMLDSVSKINPALVRSREENVQQASIT